MSNGIVVKLDKCPCGFTKGVCRAKQYPGGCTKKATFSDMQDCRCHSGSKCANCLHSVKA